MIATENNLVVVSHVDGTTTIIICGTSYHIQHARLIEYLPEHDLRRYQCNCNGSTVTVTVNCGVTPPTLDITGYDEVEIDHHIQEMIIDALSHDPNKVVNRIGG
ncbi:hypothetical protein YTPLAS72_03350 [Nitrospira sp.]|nr:hypothetical protein YTPLAS72_03350 [Nitrospira sp.]